MRARTALPLLLLTLACGAKSSLLLLPSGSSRDRDAEAGTPDDGGPDADELGSDGSRDGGNGDGNCRDLGETVLAAASAELLFPTLARLGSSILLAYTIRDSESWRDYVRTLPLSVAGDMRGTGATIDEGTGGTMATLESEGAFVLAYGLPGGGLGSAVLNDLGEIEDTTGPIDRDTRTIRPALAVSIDAYGVAWDSTDGTSAFIGPRLGGGDGTIIDLDGQGASAAASEQNSRLIRFATIDGDWVRLWTVEPRGDVVDEIEATVPGIPVAARVVRDPDDSGLAVLYESSDADQAAVYLEQGGGSWSWWFDGFTGPVDLAAAYDGEDRWTGAVASTAGEAGFDVFFVARRGDGDYARYPWPHVAVAANADVDEPPRPALVETGARGGEFYAVWNEPRPGGTVLVGHILRCE